MHIKQVLVEGFKTYKDPTALDPFDPGHNVIVGKNGSGKSNVFAAIQFVLGDKYSTLRADERQKLLHEGAGRDVISASVEIIFDNSDGRFPMEKKEVSLKRTIGLKKDEYFVNHKHSNKTEVHSLLETAGLSKENPYYIVQQGKVDSLVHMTDEKRLELLKEIAGTKTYDERRKESLKIMNETDSRREQIEEVIKDLESRLDELEGEKEELQQFQKLDMERRSLEYAIYDKELQNATSKLDAIDKSREDSAQQTQKLHEAAAKMREEISGGEEERSHLEKELSKLKEKTNYLTKDRQVYGEKKAILELKTKEHHDRIKTGQSRRTAANAEWKTLNIQIQDAKRKLEGLTKTYEKKLAEEEDIKSRFQICEQRLHSLHAKQSRTAQFSSRAERDKYLSSKMKDCKSELSSTKQQISKLKKEIQAQSKTAKVMVNDVKKTEKKLTSERSRLAKITKEIDTATKQRNEVNNKRKELWKRAAVFKKEHNECKEKLEKSQNDLQCTVDRHLFGALKEVKKFVAEKKIKGYHGPLIELFSCGAAFRKCVETTASNALFQVVVDTDSTASKIIDHLQKTKSGRLTFMPLNRLREFSQKYPEASSEAVAMIDKLSFDERFRKAMMQVFGKTLITRSLEAAAKFARSADMNTITMDGDQVNKRGAVTGGFIDHKRSRLEAHENMKVAKSRLLEIEEKKKKIEEQVEAQNQLEAKFTSAIYKSYAEKRHIRNICDQLQSDIKKSEKDREVELNKKRISEKEVAKLETDTKQLGAQIESLQSEMKSDLVEELNTQDQDEVENLTSESTELKQKLIDIGGLRTEAESKKTVLENDLSTNLSKRAEELKVELNSQSQEEASEEYEKDNQDLQRLAETVADFDSQIKDAETTVDRMTSRLNTIQGKLERLRNKESAQEQKLENESKEVEKIVSKRNNLVQQQQDCRKRIRDVGALARDAYTKHKSKSVKQLMQLLEKCNARLKKFSHVNKKALGQYQSFTSQREELLTRKEELDKGRESIHGLIEHLDQKKDEAIQRTFKGIAKHFSSVFKKLVLNGKGTLQIKKKEDAKHVRSTENYAGVGIKVSFTGGSGGDRLMKQLSGGQRSVVALALIFAIQLCDPSPFYLFDEIDANLDAVYRKAVADMIHEQKGSAQFITTTFRPELLHHADKFYGVVFQNRVSKVTVIEQDEARHIISEVEREL